VEITSCSIVELQKLRCYKGIMSTNLVQSITDEQLLRDLKQAAAHERHATAQLIALLAEMDARRLYLVEGYSSLFVYCTRCLHLSEHAAYRRIEVARAARKCPLVLELLEEGAITLTTICLLANHLTLQNHRELLEAARHKSKREVEEQIATLRPMSAVSSLVRKLPQPNVSAPRTTIAAPVEHNAPRCVTAGCAGGDQSPTPQVRCAPPIIAPLAPERYKVQLTIGRETYNKLRKAQDLLCHIVPNGDPAVVLDRALTLLLKDLEQRKLAKVERPRAQASANTKGRHVPATGLVTGRRTMRVSRSTGTVRRTGISGIPSCDPVRRGRPFDAGEPAAALSRAQWVRSQAILWLVASARTVDDV
jgi:predicted DNA-binding ribbon-helix-helix protein